MKTTGLLILVLCLNLNFSAQFCSDFDKEKLKEIWIDLNEPILTNWDFNANNFELNDSWQGITMSPDGCRVEEINLPSIGLTGTLSQSIGFLDKLTRLQLAFNDIGGELPEEFGNLGNLTFINLSNNDFVGQIPESLEDLSQLESLLLANNEFVGNINPDYVQLSNLELLGLGGNNLTGSIPPVFGNLPNLTLLNVLNNNLSGSIPEELGNISTLQRLIVGNNELTGPIPDEIGDLPVLRVFHSENNLHTGPLPKNILVSGSLPSLWLHGNSFSGCIPHELDFYCPNQSILRIENNPLLDNDDFSTFCSNGNGVCVDPASDFVTTWKTSNNGSSNDQTIFIPTVGGGPVPYNYDVDWENDGVFDDFGVTASISHTYPAIGQYTVRIRGDFPRIYFNNNFDKEKIVSVDQWGTGKWQTMFRAFWGCSNLSIFATDAPDFSETTNLVLMFAECGPIEANLSDWDVSTITSMSGMFQGSELSTPNYDTLLIAWSQQILQPNILFNAGSSRYCDGEFARQDILDNYNWNLTDGGPGTGCNPDIDGDGNLNEEDCDPYDPTVFVGSSCDDGDPSTTVDLLNQDCICQGYTGGQDCSNAIPITNGITYSPGIALLGGASASNTCFEPESGTNSLWYVYTATVCELVTVTSGIDPNEPDTRLSIFDDCGAESCIAFDDDAGPGFTSITTFMAQAGETYYVEWDDRWNDASFSFEISATVSACPGDFDLNMEINGADFAFFLGNFGIGCIDNCSCVTDLDHNGITDGDDFAIFLGNFGLSCR